jgi:hypothetical protein
VHGFALQPPQQLFKVLLILSPLLASGPLNYLITLLSNEGQSLFIGEDGRIGNCARLEPSQARPYFDL